MLQITPLTHHAKTMTTLINYHLRVIIRCHAIFITNPLLISATETRCGAKSISVTEFLATPQCATFHPAHTYTIESHEKWWYTRKRSIMVPIRRIASTPATNRKPMHTCQTQPTKQPTRREGHQFPEWRPALLPTIAEVGSPYSLTTWLSQHRWITETAQTELPLPEVRFWW